MSEKFKKTMQERRSHYLFGTNFGYEGRDLERAISMFSIGFENGFMDLEESINNLNQTIQRQKAEIDLLEKSNDFYANNDNWFGGEKFGQVEEYHSIDDDDRQRFDYVSGRKTEVGGKLARQTKQELEKLRGEK